MPQLTSDDDEDSRNKILEKVIEKQEFKIPVLDLNLSTISVSSCDTMNNNVVVVNDSNLAPISDKNNLFQNSQLVIQAEQVEPSNMFCRRSKALDSSYELYNYQLNNNVRKKRTGAD